MNLEALIDEIDSKATAHPYINSFIFEDLEEVNSSHATDYPMCLVRPAEDEIIPRKNEQQYNIEMYLLDVFYQDDAKTLRQKYSDMQDWGVQLIQELYDVPEIKNVGGIRVDRGQDEYNDSLVVLQFSFQVSVHHCMDLLTKPTSLTAAAVSSSQIDLNWNDNENDETNYEIFRSTDLSNWSLIATIPASSNSYSNISLEDSTLYFYKVRAVAARNYSSFSNFSYATTTA